MNKKEKLIYLAGFVDGEGCLTTNRTSQNGRYRPSLRVSGTYEPIMKWMKRWFGGNYYVIHARTGQTKETYDWVLSTNKAIKLIEALMPYLKVKKEEAKVFVQLYKCDVSTSFKLARRLSCLKRKGCGHALKIA